MASLSAFNEMLKQFLDELKTAFPHVKALNKYRTSIDILIKANPKKILTAFMESVGPHQQAIMAKDETVLTGGKVEFLSLLKVEQWWTPDVSQGTRDAVWQYIQTLVILGSTITSIPAEALQAIEGIATQLAEGGAAGGGKGGPGGLDPAALSGIMGMFGNLKLN